MVGDGILLQGAGVGQQLQEELEWEEEWEEEEEEVESELVEEVNRKSDLFEPHQERITA